MSEQTLRIEWPVGPTYDEWVGEPQGTPQAWTRYKLRSAAWFIDVLDQVGSQRGFERLVGVEMALDGAISGLSSAFDAAVAGLIVACEERLDRHAQANGIDPPKTEDPWHYGWKILAPLLVDARVTGRNSSTATTCAVLRHDIDVAVAATAPAGWLGTFRKLRNRATHQDTLARHIDVHVGTEQRTTWQLSVDGQGVDPVVYLRTTRTRVEQLTGDMLRVASLLAPNGMATTLPTDS